MSLSIDGNSLVFDGTVTITNATDITTGVATLMLTPSGGVGVLPALATGGPGLPALFDSIEVIQVPFGSTPPDPQIIQTDPGGAGSSSHYRLVFGVNTGEQGPAGTMHISTAADLENGPPGSSTDHYMLKWVNADAAWKIVAQLCGGTASATSFVSAAGNATNATLASLTIAAQPFDWYPRVTGFAVPTGTGNTHVDLVARLNNATTGDQVGFGPGMTGAGTTVPALPVHLVQAFGGAIGPTLAYGKVSKGSAATIYMVANQTASTSDSYSVPGTSCSFTVKVDPVPNTN